jgi:hypothetical protein
LQVLAEADKWRHGIVVSSKEIRVADVNIQFWLCCEKNDLSGMNRCLAMDANTNGHYRRRTPLMIASECGHLAVVMRLLELRVSINVATFTTALNAAIRKRHGDVVTALLDAGAATDMRADDEEFPLLVAIYAGNLFAVTELVRRGANLNAVGNKQLTPLQVACSLKSLHGSLDAAEELICNGCDFDPSTISELLDEMDRERLAACREMYLSPLLK